MKTTYRLPSELRQQMRSIVAKEYNAKSKSRWIREAIDTLLVEDTSLLSVGVGDDLEVNEVLDTVDLGLLIPDRIDKAIATLRRQDPLLEGIMASIIRAAIRRRLAKWKRLPPFEKSL